MCGQEAWGETQRPHGEASKNNLMMSLRTWLPVSKDSRVAWASYTLSCRQLSQEHSCECGCTVSWEEHVTYPRPQ